MHVNLLRPRTLEAGDQALAVVEKRKRVFLMQHGIVANILASLARPRRDRLVVVCLDLHGLHSIGLLHLVVLVCDCPAVVRNVEGCDSSREGAVQQICAW